MDYVKPVDVVQNMAEAGKVKNELSILNILLRAMLSGAFLGYATTLAFTGAVQTKLDIVGALIFPVGFIIIFLMNLELVTGSFATIPIAVLRKKTTVPLMLRNFFWAFTGNLLGALFYAFLFTIYLTHLGHIDVSTSALAQKVIQVAESKTIVYKELGFDGQIVMFVKALLCNWMVTVGAVMSFTSTATIGKIAAMWIPVFIFFAQGFEHSIVNMFAIPCGMMLGADISFSDWWLWNQITVTVGNFISGFLFTALVLHYTTKPKEQLPELNK